MTLVDLDGVQMRQETVAFDVMDAALNVIGAVYPVRDSPPRVNNDTRRTIKRSLSGMTLTPVDAAAVNPFTDRIRPRWVIAGDSAVYPLGVFLFADANELVRSSGATLDAELVDQMFIVDQPILSTVSYPIGQPLDTAIADLASTVSVPLVQVDASGLTLQRPATWPGGTSLYRILADLCVLAGFLPPYFDSTGTLRCVQAPDPGTATATRSYPAGSPIIDPSIVRTDELLTAPNLWVIVDTGATAGPIVGTYELPAAAPHSFFHRGFYVTSYTEQQGLFSAAAADAAAQALAVTDPHGVERASFDTVCDPRHDTFDVVDYGGRRWLEEAWSVACVAGASQSHEMRALYDT